MAIQDPDEEELNEYTGIDIFVPGTAIERELDGSNMVHILVLTGVALGATVLVGVAIAFPLIIMGLIRLVDFPPFIIFEPYAFLIFTVSEIGFIIPPIWYVRKRGYGLDTLGVKNLGSFRDIGLGLALGAGMILANLAVSALIGNLFQIPEGDMTLVPLASDPMELVAWIVTMFVIVGFSEELLFRGFLQRRMEIYFKGRSRTPAFNALIITSFIFAAIHFDLIGLPTRFVLGILLGYLAQKRNYSIVGPTIAHGFNNAAVVVLVFFGF
ncbi:MAG: lysostaphin resistance A-like protein [Promethearchaeota archaeon]